MELQTQAAASGARPVGEILFVLDTNARPPKPLRVHEVLLEDGTEISYTFKANEYTEMPAAHGARFLKDEAFVVKDAPEGARIMPIPKVAEVNNLGVDEVVAKLDELTIQSLLKRAQVLVGGERFTIRNKKNDIIDFLVAAAPKRTERDTDGTVAIPSGDAIGGDMSGEEIDRMFPKE